MMTRKRNKNQAGFIVTIELLLIAAILVIGLVVGMTNMRDATLAELSDLSESIGALNQSYTVDGVSNAALTAATAGSEFIDGLDTVNGGNAIDHGGPNSGAETFFSPANVDEADPATGIF
ncbi:MAG TPA: hypothetical protein VF701_03460 [Thermoanaerobaculia bacterium]